MKITVKPQHTTKETPYPKLMASIHTSLIVFMVKPREGVVLSSYPNSIDAVGDYSKEWSRTSFKDYKGTITLENTHEA